MDYAGKLYRPPSEAHSYILQATIGCSWNACTYCDMYRDKPTFRLRPLKECLEHLNEAGARFGDQIEKLFVADGDALVMELERWEPILARASQVFPRLRQVSCYAMARNILEKSGDELKRLREMGLSLLYVGPESGDDTTLKRIAKGSNFKDHAMAASKAHRAGMKLSVIMLLGAGGTERSEEHAQESARLITEMDPEFFSALTLTVVPGTPLARMEARGKFELPRIETLLSELRTMVAESRPSKALFRTNHASNYLPLAGTLPADRERIVQLLDRALSGEVQLRPEWSRGL
ncbi:MAG: radical SAM protein [Rickettsiales bacterium]|nr:radical SAM protein [Rickettsiales bacterium]|tara:strand:+ start:620 stop:1495 length:876 start_codon:yes stop_codon:yes gene_type:complete